MNMLEQRKSIAWDEPGRHDSALAVSPLFGAARGKMFGVMETVDTVGKTVWLYAFSGQFNGRWMVPGWAPPLFDVESFNRINEPAEREIKTLGRRLDSLPEGSPQRLELQRERRRLSRKHMEEIHTLYRVHNFRGLGVSLDAAFNHTGNKPTGTGDCCAPKLLNQAALSGLKPRSLAEFYFGRENRSGSRFHGRFFAPCQEKCAPLLGFMLCGLGS